MTFTCLRVAALVALALGPGAGCGDGDNRPDMPAPIDAGSPDAACFEDPKTYHQIINACTTAVKVYKDSRPPLLRPDGTVPPLP